MIVVKKYRSYIRTNYGFSSKHGQKTLKYVKILYPKIAKIFTCNDHIFRPLVDVSYLYGWEIGSTRIYDTSMFIIEVGIIIA